MATEELKQAGAGVMGAGKKIGKGLIITAGISAVFAAVAIYTGGASAVITSSAQAAAASGQTYAFGAAEAFEIVKTGIGDVGNGIASITSSAPAGTDVASNLVEPNPLDAING